MLLQLSRTEEAAKYLRDASTISREVLGRDNLQLGFSLSMLGHAECQLGHYAAAQLAWTEAADLYDRYRSKTPNGANRYFLNPLSREGIAAALVHQNRGDDAWAELERGLATYMLEALPQDAATATR